MALINTLSVDIGQPSENKEVFSSGKANDSNGDSRQFSSFMAYEQGKSQAEKRQDSGNELQKSAKDVDGVNEPNNETAAKDSAETPQKPIEKVEHTVEQTKSSDKQPLESIELDTVSDDFHNKRAEVAIKLLDFITASEGTSTNKIAGVSEDTAKSTTVSVNKEAAISSNENGPELESEGGGEDEIENSAIKMPAVEASKQANGDKVNTNTKDEAKGQAEKKVEVNQEHVQNEEVWQNKDVGKDTVLAGQTQTDKHNQQIVQAKVNNDVSANKPSAVNNTMDASDAQLNELSPDDSEAIGVQDSEIVMDKKAKDRISPIKPRHDNANTASTADVEKALANENKADTQVEAKNQPVSANPTVSDNTNKAVFDKASEPRVVNQATNTLVSTGEEASDQTSSEQENPDQATNRRHEVLVKEQVQVVNKTSSIELSSERTTQQTTANSSNDLDAKIQTAHERELASIQASVNRPSHESLSTQSAKTTQAILQDTISINRKDFSVAVKEKVMVAINQKLRQLDIRLDPPELGSMQVKLNLQNEQAAVNFVVQSQQAKEALEQHMGKLKDMLAQSGVDVGDANIEQRDNQSSEQASSQGQRQHNDATGDDELANSLEQVNPNLYKASSTGIDYYA